MDNRVLFLFKNTRTVVKAEKAIRLKGVKCLIIPVPKNISSECGMCIEVEKDTQKDIEEILLVQQIPFNKG